MRSTQTFSVDFIARRCKEDPKMAFIYAKIFVDGIPKELSLKDKIKDGDFDWGKEKVKGNTQEARAINEHIADVRCKLREKYRELYDNGQLVTAAAVKAAYLGIQESKKGHSLIELLNYFEKIWTEELSEGSMKNYRTTIEYAKRFIAYQFKEDDVYLSQINMEFATDLEDYIRKNPIKEHDPSKGNGLAKNMQRFKRIVKWAKTIQWLQVNSIAEYSAGVKKSKRKKLSLDEVFLIEGYNFVNKELAYVRDLFIFSCYTGLAFADVMGLCTRDLELADDGTLWCKIYRKKSDELAAVPFLKKATALIDKYWDKGNVVQGGTIFPQLTNQYVNRQLKVIQEILSIILKMDFHLARHTFAKTIALKHKIPLETVQIMLGHTKITTTQIYADVDEEKVMDDMEGLDDKLDKKRALYVASVQGKQTTKKTLIA